MNDIRQLACFGGCGGKLSPAYLTPLIQGMKSSALVDHSTFDDAAVHLIEVGGKSGDALVHTVDVIAPVAADPYEFGQIAAANALSDIYAMGGQPIAALNICAFPTQGLNQDEMSEILRGGSDKAVEAGAFICGGHTIWNSELRYGMCVIGTCPISKVTRNSAARVGDLLVLTKPLGVGLYNSGNRDELVSKAEMQDALSSMKQLNDAASRAMLRYDVSACTDITGFGLGGHTLEMAVASGISIRIVMGQVPLLPRVPQLISLGVSTSMTGQLRDYVSRYARFRGENIEILVDVLYDPQTSGGLLIGVRPDQASELVRELINVNCKYASIIGECLPKEEMPLVIT